MPDDQVTIDPEFQPPLPDDGQRRWLRLIGIVGLAVGAFIFGWLLRSPSPTEPDPTERGAPSTTVLKGETRETSTATTSTAPAVVGLPVPLGEAVPGLTDSITIWATAGHGYQILRWRLHNRRLSRWRCLRTMNRTRSTSWMSPRMVGASGFRWDAECERPTGGDTDSESSASGVEAVAVRIGSAAWHDSQPGLLARLTCPRVSTGSSALYTFDALDVAAEPVAIRAFDRACEADSGVWLRDWGRWGFLIGMDDGVVDPPIDVLLGLDGDEIARSDRSQSQRVSFIVGNPDGTTTWIDETDNGWFVLSADGQQRSPLPDLGDGEPVEDAWWIPDGTLLALGYGRSLFGPLGRIVEVATGEVIAEPAASGQDIGATAWSTDSRFYLYMLGTDLVFLDTVTTASVAVPLPGLVFAIRPH